MFEKGTDTSQRNEQDNACRNEKSSASEIVFFTEYHEYQIDIEKIEMQNKSSHINWLLVCIKQTMMSVK